MTPLDHANATATVAITGLALGCYNKATQNYEVGFLRYDCHDLRIEVTKKLPGGNSVMIYEIKDHQHRIFIDAENAVSPDFPIYTAGDERLDRTQSNHDREDFRWVIDFENDLNCGNPVELRPPSVPVTEMYVSKPRLYADTDLFTPEKYLLVRIDPGTNEPVEEEEKVLGFFSQGIKADITCQNGGAVILRVEGPQGFQVHLPHSAGQPHEITITNICTPKAKSEDEEEEEEISAEINNGSSKKQQTDFRLYYSVIKETNGERYDIKSPVHGEGAVCNGSTLGGRASLFPLPASNA